MLPTQLNIILQSIRKALTNFYQGDLDCLILFGSQARGDATEFSDIDILAVIKSEINPYQEIKKTNNIIADYSLENDVLISCHFISSQKFNTQNTPFLANVKREGIIL